MEDEDWCKYNSNVIINQKFCSLVNTGYAVASLSNAIHITERHYSIQDYHSVEDKTWPEYLPLVSIFDCPRINLYYKE